MLYPAELRDRTPGLRRGLPQIAERRRNRQTRDAAKIRNQCRHESAAAPQPPFTGCSGTFA
jgi:hypothetical protein